MSKEKICNYKESCHYCDGKGYESYTEEQYNEHNRYNHYNENWTKKRGEWRLECSNCDGDGWIWGDHDWVFVKSVQLGHDSWFDVNRCSNCGQKND